MERFTRRAHTAVVYIRPEAQYQDTGDIPAEMSTPAIRAAIHRLAEYEDTGLTPEQITILASDKLETVADMLVDTVPTLVQAIVELLPQLVEAAVNDAAEELQEG